MKSLLHLIIISLFLVGCNSDEPKLAAIGNIDSGSTTAPYITNVSVPTFRTYTLGETLDFYVTFNKPVTVIGTPRLTFVTDTGSVNANYADGSGSYTLHFSATLASGTIDENGITLSQMISLNGGSIYDIVTDEDAILTFTSPLTWGIYINSGSPQLLSVIPPVDMTYITGQKLTFRALFNSRVCVTGSPRLTIDVGGTPKYPTWDSTRAVCDTSHYFDYTVAVGESDLDGIQLTGTSIDLTTVASVMKNAFNVNAVVTHPTATYANVKVNGAAAAPVIVSKSVPTDDTYVLNEVLTFTVTYNEAVSVSNMSPRLVLDVNGATRYANYIGGSGTNTLTFTYTVPSTDTDLDGVQITGFDIGTATIRNSSLVNAPTPTVGSWASLSNVKVDGVVPTEISRLSPANGIRTLNQNIIYQVNFNEPVVVTGYPNFAITLTTGTVYANYASGSGTSSLTFSYNVQEGDEDLNGIVTATTLVFNGGTITDVAGNSYSPVSNLWPGYSVNVDAKNPQITSVEFVTPGAFKSGEIAQLKILWSEPVNYTGTASIDFTAGGSTVTFLESVKSGSQIIFNYTVGAGLIDYDGISLASAILGTSAITDGVGRSPSSSVVPAPSNKVYFVPTFLVNWYDTSDLATVGTSSASLLQFKDLVSGAPKTITGTIPYATSTYRPPLKYAEFTGAQKIQYGFINLNYMVAVVDTTGNPGGPFLETDSATPTVYLEFNSGNLIAPSCSIGGTCYSRNGAGFWSPVSTFTQIMMPYATNTIKIIAVKYPSSSNNYRIGTGFVGRVHEVFFLNSSASTESEITDIINHLQTKYGVSY